MNKKALAFKTIVVMVILIVVMFIIIGIAKVATGDSKELLLKFFELFK